MTDFIGAPLTVVPDELETKAYDFLRGAIPGWEPAPSNLDAWIIAAFAAITASVAETASDVTTAIFRHFGANLAGLPPREATAATGLTTWTMRDTAGHTIDAGTAVAFEGADGLVAFQTVDEVEVPSGSSTLAAVPVTAVETGAQGSGLTGEGQLVEQFDPLVSVALDSPTTGGADPEPDDDYLDRLASELRLLTPRPILADDFAVLAKRVVGVGRATAIDGYNPATSTFGNERMVTVAVVAEDGTAVPSGVKAEVDALLEAERELNFVVNVIDPTYTSVDVAFTATAWPGSDPATVEVNAIAAVESYLAPATWGQPDFGEALAWVNEDKVRIGELYAVLNSVEGLRHVDTLTINGAGADVTLTGVAPLPEAGAITGTVS